MTRVMKPKSIRQSSARPLNDVTCQRSVTLLYSLQETETRGFGWVGRLRDAHPEIEPTRSRPS